MFDSSRKLQASSYDVAAADGVFAVCLASRLPRFDHVKWLSERAHDAVYGVIAGVNAAASMSVLRIAARRVGLLDVMPPQVLRESLSGRRGAPVTRHFADHAIHLAVGGAGGAFYGVLFGRRAGIGSGFLWGALFWAASLAMFVPILGRRRARDQARLPQSAVNLVAHLVYGGVVALMTGDMERQNAERRRRADRQAARVG